MIRRLCLGLSLRRLRRLQFSCTHIVNSLVRYVVVLADHRLQHNGSLTWHFLPKP